MGKFWGEFLWHWGHSKSGFITHSRRSGFRLFLVLLFAVWKWCCVSGCVSIRLGGGHLPTLQPFRPPPPSFRAIQRVAASYSLFVHLFVQPPCALVFGEDQAILCVCVWWEVWWVFPTPILCGDGGHSQTQQTGCIVICIEVKGHSGSLCSRWLEIFQPLETIAVGWWMHWLMLK